MSLMVWEPQQCWTQVQPGQSGQTIEMHFEKFKLLNVYIISSTKFLMTRIPLYSQSLPITLNWSLKNEIIRKTFQINSFSVLPKFPSQCNIILSLVNLIFYSRFKTNVSLKIHYQVRSLREANVWQHLPCSKLHVICLSLEITMCNQK